MAIQLDTSRIAAQTTATAAQGDIAAPLAEKTPSVLGGENLKVTSAATTDLEKLVAQLKNENEVTRQSVAQRRTAILATVLDSMADRISAAEKENLIKLEGLNGEKSEAMKELSGLTNDKAVMESLIESLDRQIEQAVKDGEDHREQVAKLKAQRAEEQAKLDGITQSIKSVTTKIAGIDAKIAECTKTIAQTTLNEVANALRIAEDSSLSQSSTKEVSKESDAERKKAEEKAAATDIGNVIRDALDKIDSQILQAIAESQELVKA